MTNQPLQIPIDKIKADFQTFLAPNHNRRIIFSGPFGIGKTYFLNKFFEEREEYFPVFLRPINYSLLSNEDVFKFIKYDILAQIIQDDQFEIGENFNFSGTEYAKFYTGQNGFSILFNLLKYAPKVGAFVKASEKLGILVEKFKEGLKEVNENPELKMLKEFGEQAENHFLYENDGVTEFISEQMDNLVTTLNGEETKQKRVLIIDDLDRLDPEHIFRLFNVFSAHFDQVNYHENSVEGEIKNDNKFGFDKIIFVCDIENIRKIFAHKYGNEVDFSGYIDKFYSTEVYLFLHELDFRDEIYPYFEIVFQNSFNDNYDSKFFNITKLIFQLLFDNNEISIRDMKRIEKLKRNAFLVDRILVPFESCFAPKDSFMSIYGLLISLRVFRCIYGNNEVLSKKLIRALKKNKLTKDGGYYHHEIETVIPQLLLFSEIEIHKFKTKEENYKYTLRTGEDVEYSLSIHAANTQFISESPLRYNINLHAENRKLVSEFQRLLINSIENIFKYGLLK